MSCTTTGGDAAPVVTEIFFAIESAFMQKSKKEEKKSQPSKSSADKIKLIAVKKDQLSPIASKLSLSRKIRVMHQTPARATNV